jgi:gas vesicle protein
MRYLLAALGGAVVGAGAALLLAPQSGEETRTLIRDKATKTGTDIQEMAQEKTTQLRSKLHGYREDVDSALQKGQDLLSQGKEKLSGLTSGRAAETMADSEMMPPVPAI